MDKIQVDKSMPTLDMLEPAKGHTRGDQEVNARLPQYIFTKPAQEDHDSQLQSKTKPPSEEDFKIINLVSNWAFGAVPVRLVKNRQTRQ